MTENRADIEYSLLDLVLLFRRFLPFVATLMIVAMLLAFLSVQFLVQPRYVSRASLLPGKPDAVQQRIPILERGAFRSAFRFGNVTTRNSLNLEVMLSDRVRGKIVEDLGLIDFFGLKEMRESTPLGAYQEAMEQLTQATHFEISLQLQVLIVVVTTHDSEMSARIANHYLDVTEQVLLDRLRNMAREKSRFLEGRIEEVKDQIERHELRIIEHIQSTGVGDTEMAMESAFSLLSPVESTIIDLQLRRDILAADMDPAHPELIEIEAELQVYEEFIARLDSIGADSGLRSPVRVGEASRTRVRLEHELSLLKDLELSLVEARETARLQSVLDMKTLTILDHAVPEVEPTWPRKRLTVMFSGLVALVVASALALFLDILERLGGGSRRDGLKRLMRET